MKQFVFVSSVQKELAHERAAVRDFIRGDALLGLLRSAGAGRGAHYQRARERLINGSNGSAAATGPGARARQAAGFAYVPDGVKTGYEISFIRYFYKPQPLRTLDEIRADILTLEKETEGLLGEIVGSERA